MALAVSSAWQEGFACQVSVTQYETMSTHSCLIIGVKQNRGEPVSVCGNPDRKTAASNFVVSDS